MSDDEQAGKIEPKDLSGTPPQDRDWLLAELVKFSNLGLGFDIILSANGQTISGKTISNEMYFEETAKRAESTIGMLSSADRETIESLANYYRSFKNIGKKPDDAPIDYVTPTPRYIHLTDARVVGEERDLPTTGGLLWRGRLSEITGFALGSLSRS